MTKPDDPTNQDPECFDNPEGEEIDSLFEEQSLDTIVAAIARATQKLKELGERGVLPDDEEMEVLLQSPGVAELWKRFALQIQMAEEDEFELISLEDAQDFLEISAGLSPTDVEAKAELGSFLLVVNDQTEDALTVFSQARALCLEQLEESSAGMAACLLEMGQQEEARLILEQTLPLCPESELLLDILKDVNEAGSNTDDI